MGPTDTTYQHIKSSVPISCSKQTILHPRRTIAATRQPPCTTRRLLVPTTRHFQLLKHIRTLKNNVHLPTSPISTSHIPLPFPTMASTTRDKLLKLDSSAHLRSYRRNLGPFRITSPVERLGQQAQGARTGDVVGLEETRWTRMVNHAVHAIQDDYPAPIPVHIRVPAVLSRTAAPAVQPPALTLRSAMMPLAHAVPPLLRAALEHSRTFADDGAVYEVFQETAGAYVGDEVQVVSAHCSLHTANERAVQHFLETYMCAAVDEPEVEVREGGMIRCAVETDGSMGGNTTVYVRLAKGPGVGRRV